MQFGMGVAATSGEIDWPDQKTTYPRVEVTRARSRSAPQNRIRLALGAVRVAVAGGFRAAGRGRSHGAGRVVL